MAVKYEGQGEGRLIDETGRENEGKYTEKMKRSEIEIEISPLRDYTEREVGRARQKSGAIS